MKKATLISICVTAFFGFGAWGYAVESNIIQIVLWVLAGISFLAIWVVTFHRQLKRIRLPLRPSKNKKRANLLKKYRPSCQIVKVGFLKITKSTNAYYFELPIDVKYTSRDPRYSIRMDCTTILLDVFHTEEDDREQTPYRLHSSTMPWRIEPLSEEGSFKGIFQKWDLPSKPPWVIKYTFIREEEGEPLIDEEVFCKIVAIGIPHIKHIPIYETLTIDDSKFPITVEGGRFLVKVDKQDEEKA